MFSGIESFQRRNIYYNLDGPQAASPLNPKPNTSVIPKLSEDPHPSKEFDDKFIRLIRTGLDFFSNRFPFRGIILKNINKSDLLEKITRMIERYFETEENTVQNFDAIAVRNSIPLLLNNPNLNTNQTEKLTTCFLNSCGFKKACTKTEALKRILEDPNYKYTRVIAWQLDWSNLELEQLCQVAYSQPNSHLAISLARLKLNKEQFLALLNAIKIYSKWDLNENHKENRKELIGYLIENEEIYKAENHDILEQIINLTIDNQEVMIPRNLIENIQNHSQLTKIAQAYKERDLKETIDDTFIQALATNKNFSFDEFKSFIVQNTSYKGFSFDYSLSKHHSKPGLAQNEILKFFANLEKNPEDSNIDLWGFATNVAHSLTKLDDNLFHRLVKLSQQKYDRRNQILYAIAESTENPKQINNLINIIDEICEAISTEDDLIEKSPTLDEKETSTDFVARYMSSSSALEIVSQQIRENSSYKFDFKKLVEHLFRNKNINISQIKRLISSINPIIQRTGTNIRDFILGSPASFELKYIFVNSDPDSDDEKEFEKFTEIAKKYPDSLSGKVYAYATTAA